MADHAGQAVINCRTGCAFGRRRPAHQAPQNHGQRENNRAGAFQEGFHPVPQAGQDVFEVGHTEGGQLHQQRELLHVALNPCQPFHEIGGESGGQNACDIQHKQRQPLQIEYAEHGLIGDDGGDNQRVHGQPRGAGQQRGDGDGHQPFARVVDGAGGHHGGHGAGKAGQQRNERTAGQAAFRHHVIQQERGARQVARVFQQQDEGEQDGNLRQEHQHAARAGNHAVHD